MGLPQSLCWFCASATIQNHIVTLLLGDASQSVDHVCRQTSNAATKSKLGACICGRQQWQEWLPEINLPKNSKQHAYAKLKQSLMGKASWTRVMGVPNEVIHFVCTQIVCTVATSQTIVAHQAAVEPVLAMLQRMTKDARCWPSWPSSALKGTPRCVPCSNATPTQVATSSSFTSLAVLRMIPRFCISASKLRAACSVPPSPASLKIMTSSVAAAKANSKDIGVAVSQERILDSSKSAAL